MSVGLQLIVLGVVKKMIFADRMAMFADPVFADPLAYQNLGIVDRIDCVSRPSLLRLLRLLGPGPRHCTHAWLSLVSQLQFAVHLREPCRVLATLAYLIINLATRLRLLSLGRKSTWRTANELESADCLHALRPMAWCSLAIRDVGLSHRCLDGGASWFSALSANNGQGLTIYCKRSIGTFVRIACTLTIFTLTLTIFRSPTLNEGFTMLWRLLSNVDGDRGLMKPESFVVLLVVFYRRARRRDQRTLSNRLGCDCPATLRGLLLAFAFAMGLFFAPDSGQCVHLFRVLDRRSDCYNANKQRNNHGTDD